MRRRRVPGPAALGRNEEDEFGLSPETGRPGSDCCSQMCLIEKSLWLLWSLGGLTIADM